MAHTDPDGLFDARYRAFLETVTHLRADLHRYCARMTGSVLDGEDVMQEALFEAYRKIEKLDDPAALRPWLFRLAHHRCIDFLRKRRARQRAEAGYAQDDVVRPSELAGGGTRRAIERLVIALPPKERACVLLKDVFDYSLEEIAELVDSTIGGVKAALTRGRAKLADFPVDAPLPSAATGSSQRAASALLHLYVDGFNRRDWDGLRELISADARLRVADLYAGRLDESGFFTRYASWHDWHLAVGDVEGELIIVVDRQFAADDTVRARTWALPAIMRLGVDEAGRITRIADYSHCPWIVPAASSFHHS
jgi:RNA polymerase sigma-70 factor, ECF subfamily